MSIKENKVMVNVGIPYNKLEWVDNDRGGVSRSNYLGEIILPEIERRMEAKKETIPEC